MNRSTQLILVGTLIGTLGVAGFTRLGDASQIHAQGAVTLQSQRSQAAETSDGDGETNDDVKEQQESANLQKLAKITAQQAQQAAETAQKAKASRVTLENEDGNLVYSVAIAGQEVKVDAGNGQVLYTDSANHESKAKTHPRSSIQVQSQNGDDDGDGETNDDG